jgi:hypothetical protein
VSYGGIAAVTAAAQKRRQALLDEEKEMTQYSQDDLNDEWEFKIVRSGTAAFRKATVLNRLIEEEARAGWVMLEKLDDSRIRFKRPRRARAQDAYLPDDADAYRTHYGSPARYTMTALLMVGAILLLVLGILAFVVASR